MLGETQQVAEALVLLHSALFSLHEAFRNGEYVAPSPVDYINPHILDVAEQLPQVRGTIVRELLAWSLELASRDICTLRTDLMAHRTAPARDPIAVATHSPSGSDAIPRRLRRTASHEYNVYVHGYAAYAEHPPDRRHGSHSWEPPSRDRANWRSPDIYRRYRSMSPAERRPQSRLTRVGASRQQRDRTPRLSRHLPRSHY